MPRRCSISLSLGSLVHLQYEFSGIGIFLTFTFVTPGLLVNFGLRLRFSLLLH